MLPRLQAEERLSMLNLITAGGSVQVSDQSYRSLARDLERSTGMRRQAIKASPADIASLGIAIEVND